MKKCIWTLVLVTLLAACKSPKKEIDVLSDGSKFKLIAFEDHSDSLRLNQYLFCYITIADTLKENSSEILELRIRAIDFIDPEEVENTLMDNLGKRLKEEERQITQYLAKQVDNAAYWYEQGIYIKSELKTTNSPLSYGDQVTLEYQGQFLNGYVFDSKKGDKALEIVYGMSDQVISGIEQGIKGLSEGESVKIILPSHLAFGAEGSVKGIVPPYTPVAYNIFIKKVTHKN